jgi:phage gp36-like protein
MAYVSIQELETFGVNPGALDGFTEAQITNAIDAAQSEADQYIGLAAAVPLNPVPPVVKLHVSRMAVWNLLSSRGNINLEGPDRVLLENYKLALKFLESVSKRQVTLGVTTAPPLDDPSDNVEADFVYGEDDRGWSGGSV